MSNIDDFIKLMEPIKKDFERVCDVYGIDGGVALSITKNGPLLTIDVDSFPKDNGKLYPAISVSKTEKLSDTQYKIFIDKYDVIRNNPEILIIASTNKEGKVLYIDKAIVGHNYLIIESEEEIKVGEIMIDKTENLANSSTI